MNAEETALEFVRRINRADVVAICDLMTEDHRFIDTVGRLYEGADTLRRAWVHYYGMIPDYMIDISKTFVLEETVALFGTASGTYAPEGTIHAENHWKTPGAWRAVVRDGKISEWQIFADLEPLREIIRRELEQNE